MSNTNSRGMILISTLIIMLLVISILLALQQHLLINRFQHRQQESRFFDEVIIENEIRRHQGEGTFPSQHTISMDDRSVNIYTDILEREESGEFMRDVFEERIEAESLIDRIDTIMTINIVTDNQKSGYALFYKQYPADVLWIERLPLSSIEENNTGNKDE